MTPLEAEDETAPPQFLLSSRDVYWPVRTPGNQDYVNHYCHPFSLRATGNLPLDLAVDRGATTVLAIRCKCERTRREPVHGIANILLRSFELQSSGKIPNQES